MKHRVFGFPSRRAQEVYENTLEKTTIEALSYNIFMVILDHCRINRFVRVKGLERQRLIGSAVAGFNHARTITKASTKGLDTRQDDHNKSS